MTTAAATTTTSPIFLRPDDCAAVDTFMFKMNNNGTQIYPTGEPGLSLRLFPLRLLRRRPTDLRSVNGNSKQVHTVQENPGPHVN